LFSRDPERSEGERVGATRKRSPPENLRGRG